MGRLPFHPAINPFPVFTILLASGCLFMALIRPLAERHEWTHRAWLLLLTCLAILPFVLLTGRSWSLSMGFWPRSLPWPTPQAASGLLRAHVIGATLSSVLIVLSTLAFWSYRRARVSLSLLSVLVLSTALLTAYTAHLGGRMAFGELGLESDS